MIKAWQAISIPAYLCLSGWEWVAAGHRETEKLPASSLLLPQDLALQAGLYQAGRAYSVCLSEQLGTGMQLECAQQRTGL